MREHGFIIGSMDPSVYIISPNPICALIVVMVTFEPAACADMMKKGNFLGRGSWKTGLNLMLIALNFELQTVW